MTYKDKFLAFLMSFRPCLMPKITPELFEKSANVYVRMTEEAVIGNHAFITNFKVEDLESYKAR